MYTEFYGLSGRPFSLTPDPDFLYLSKNHREALAHLTYGVESRSGFVMVTGEVGAGKTTLLRTLVRNLGDSLVLSQVTNTRVSYKELLELILEDFGLNPRGLSKTALLSTLNEFLIERYREGRNCVVIVDEAQNLAVSTLEGLRMLSNLETEKTKLLHLVLSGQPGLRDLIDSPELEQLRQRITVRYHLGPLSVGEVGEYIQHRLSRVVTDPERAPVFPDEVVPIIHQATGGIPRLVNVLCDAALLHGYVEETRELGPGLVREVAEQVRRDQEGRTEKPPPQSEEEQALKRRVDELEARLTAVASGLAQGAPVGGSERAALRRLRQKQAALASLEKELRRRLAEVERREAEFNERLVKLKEQWKRRMRLLEEARRGLLGGEWEFPAPKVFVFDPDPRVRNAACEWLEGAGIAYDEAESTETLEECLAEAGAAGWFTMAVVGSGPDDLENVRTVRDLVEAFPHVPLIYLSDVDLSPVRRRILEGGASSFLEKPPANGLSFAAHREAMEHLREDLLRVVEFLYRQHRAVFETFRPAGRGPTGDAEEEASRLGDEEGAAAEG
ncbi:XrtA/PEP-CTERM system-associated ATPase [Deferrisoma camini]|uniref:XrtA/PEP-CTERM system-associated ATPase n=1 Tax=Deferrisoma camini TaxID=1035120 RepID=UPI00046D512D|nr:XrtA/PEP-CTERM system-associated ATPase [Deferrisoma camini]